MRPMGIDAEIAPSGRDDARTVFDQHGVFAQLLADASLRDSVCLRFIDPYGDTVFNSLQMPALREELEDLLQTTSAADVRAHIARLIELVGEALANGPHTFVRFVGD